MNEMRRWQEIVEGVSTPVTSENAPAFLYHGTNPVAASMIFKDNCLEADEPSDEDGLGAVVCTSSSEEVAKMFAVEFDRFNSRFPVGFIFTLDGKAVMSNHEAVHHVADTASIDEAEYRVMDDIYPLSKYMVQVNIVGDASLLNNKRFLREMFESARRSVSVQAAFYNFDDFATAMKNLLAACRG